MSFVALPAVASWRHEGAREGFEVTYFATGDGGTRLEGTTTATEEGESWIVDYVIQLDALWLTKSARIVGRSDGFCMTTVVEADGLGRWQIDGVAAPHLDGCLDLDLESSAMTNTFPVHRLTMPAGQVVAAPAAYVRAVGLKVDRLDQTYSRVGEGQYDYVAAEFDFACRLVYDRHGLVLDYPGIATRVH